MTESKSGQATGACASAEPVHFCPDFNFRENIDLGAEMGAEPVPKQRYRETRNALIVKLVMTEWSEPGRWIAYSRDNNSYRVLRWYFGSLMSLPAVLWAVGTLEHACLIEHRKTRPSPTARFRSTIRATPELIGRSRITSVSQLRRNIWEAIRLKDSSKRLQTYTDNQNVRAWRRDVEAQNEALDALQITLAAPGWWLDACGIWTDGARALNPARNQYHRVFNADWENGGRWYGPAWQGLPSAARARLRINSEPVVELDYPHLHPTLMTAEAGCTLDDRDPYEIDGMPRHVVKRAFNTLLNADNKNKAIGSLRDKLIGDGFGTYRKAVALVAVVEQRHPAFADFWGTGKGLRLQAVDAAICARVQKKMRELGQPVLSIHDSFIAPISQKAALEAAMDEALADALRAIALKS